MGWKILNSIGAFITSGINGLQMLEERGCEVVTTEQPCPLTVESLEAALPGVDAVVAGSDNFNAEVLSSLAAKNLKIIQRWGVGYDAIDIETATREGIVVGFLPGFLDDVVADYSWALMLSMARRIPWGQASMIEGKWEPSWGHDVVGRTLGILGCGRIGMAVARRAKGFEMQLLGYDPFPNDAAREAGVEFVSLEELMEQSDFVSINAAATPANHGLIGEAELRRMKKSAYLINTARGSLLNETAIVKALEEGWIAGAALDCFEREPLAADHPLRSAPNALLCPHMAPFAWGNAQEMNRGAAQNILDLMSGKRPAMVVNPEVFESDVLRSLL